MKGKNSTSSVSAPQFPVSKKLEELKELDLVGDADYGCFQIANFRLPGIVVKDSVIDCAKFDRVVFGGTEMDECKLNDVRFEGCDLSNSIWTDGKLARVEFVDCKGTGLKIIDTQLTNVLFEKCVGKLTQMCGSIFKTVVFRGCNFAGADFSNCNFEEVCFEACDLREAIFYNAKLDGTNLCGSQLLGIKAFAADLKGAIIDQQQAIELAPQMAELLQIEVRAAKSI